MLESRLGGRAMFRTKCPLCGGTLTIDERLRRVISHVSKDEVAKKPEERFSSCAEAADFLRIAVELPHVSHYDLLSLAILHHPSARARVRALVDDFSTRLAEVPGVQLCRAERKGGQRA